MTGINYPIELDTKHIAKHLPNTPQMQRLLKKGLAVHIFINAQILKSVTQAIIERGEYIQQISS